MVSSANRCSVPYSNKFPVNWFWRRVVVDEPEIITKKRNWRIPKSAHTHDLTANLEEICAIPRSHGMFGELLSYLRDMSKMYGIDMLPRVVVKVGQDFYAECSKTPNYVLNMHVGPAVVVAEAVKQLLSVTDDVGPPFWHTLLFFVVCKAPTDANRGPLGGGGAEHR